MARSEAVANAEIDELYIAVDEILNQTDSSWELVKRRNKKKKPSKNDLFVIDTEQSFDNFDCSEMLYSCVYSIQEKEAEDEVVTNNARRGPSCFNCDGDHHLRNCAVPRDYNKIDETRQKFYNSNKRVRYHEVKNENHRFEDFKPGAVSDNLRKALGLSPNQLPDHIYKLRKFGYPPGWLKEAELSLPLLDVFDIDGNKIEEENRYKSTINPQKIIEYPGFNMPIEKGYYDEFRKHNVEPYKKSMNKSSMIKYYEDKYQKENQAESSETNVESSKTHVESNETNVRRSETCRECRCVAANKPETQKIEKKKRKKKRKNRPSVPVNSPTSVDSNEQNKNINQPGSSEDRQVKSTNDSDSSQEKVKKPSGKEDYKGVIKSTVLGTPILPIISEYKCFPKLENFSAGVSPLTYFETRSNSAIRRYEELSKILNKVRISMKNMKSSVKE